MQDLSRAKRVTANCVALFASIMALVVRQRSNGTFGLTEYDPSVLAFVLGPYLAAIVLAVFPRQHRLRWLVAGVAYLSSAALLLSGIVTFPAAVILVWSTSLPQDSVLLPPAHEVGDNLPERSQAIVLEIARQRTVSVTAPRERLARLHSG